MTPAPKPKLRQRVVTAAKEALADHQYVSLIDILIGIRYLHPGHIEPWKKGRIDVLERMMQGNSNNILQAIQIFQQWAAENGLKPSETSYVRGTRDGTVALQFTFQADPALEKIFRTHYVSAAMPEVKQKKLAEKLSRPADPVVFEILRDSECSECGTELPKDSFLFMETGQPLCLACAGLGELEYLPAGDTALTRRSKKYSSRCAVVVRFSRSRGHYERQGILVESAAIEKAEQECSADAAERAAARTVGAERRREDDRKLVAQMMEQIHALFPKCPPKEAAAIALHTAERGSGRVGRSAAGRALREEALTAAVHAAVRHNHTGYDELLASGVARAEARETVRERVLEILGDWRG